MYSFHQSCSFTFWWILTTFGPFTVHSSPASVLLQHFSWTITSVISDFNMNKSLWGGITCRALHWSVTDPLICFLAEDDLQWPTQMFADSMKRAWSEENTFNHITRCSRTFLNQDKPGTDCEVRWYKIILLSVMFSWKTNQILFFWGQRNVKWQNTVSRVAPFLLCWVVNKKCLY